MTGPIPSRNGSKRDRRAAGAAVLFCLVSVLIVAMTKGDRVALWSLVGLFGTAGYLGGTWLGIRMVGVPGTTPRHGATVLILIFLLKVPPIVLLALAARDAAPEVRDGLLYGAAMVYSVLVSWGILTTRPTAD